jgi:hypothetical protein
LNPNTRRARHEKTCRRLGRHASPSKPRSKNAAAMMRLPSYRRRSTRSIHSSSVHAQSVRSRRPISSSRWKTRDRRFGPLNSMWSKTWCKGRASRCTASSDGCRVLLNLIRDGSSTVRKRRSLAVRPCA